MLTFHRDEGRCLDHKQNSDVIKTCIGKTIQVLERKLFIISLTRVMVRFIKNIH